jgi:putative two-component system response regulator
LILCAEIIYIDLYMSKKTIFLVDDKPTNLMAGQNALEGHYNVLTMNSGARLLKALEKRAPDLILLDVDMPEMDGYEVIKIIKGSEKTANIPVIFLTAKNDSDSELLGLTLGAVDYITKPFSPPRLLKRIEIHLLIENQKKELVAQQEELINFNNNLQEMVEVKTKSVLELQSAILKTTAELVEFRDNTTGGHIERTTRYLGILLGEMEKRGLYGEGVSPRDRDLLMQSAQLHDVGKIAVRDSVLQKPGKLTPEEFDEIKKHPVFGREVIERIKKSTTERSFLEYAGIFAASHHEKWDGSGYPLGLSGDSIPLLGRLMAVADVYDALVSERPYKKAFSHEEAVRIITEGSGSHFDPTIVDLFLSVTDEFNEATVNSRKGEG